MSRTPAHSSARTLERTALFLAWIVLAASVQFCAGLGGAVATLLGAAVVGVLATLAWTRLHLPERHAWLPPISTAAVSLGAVLVLEFTFRNDFAEWFAFLLAGSASAITVAVQRGNRRRCSLCQRRLGRQAVTFRCPRCAEEVCEQTCWDFEHRRCRLCLEQRVPILPTAENWWLRVTGPRARQGRCQICLASAEAADLRSCPRCRRTECRDCWDFNNGECARCGAALPDLPTSLRLSPAQLPPA